MDDILVVQNLVKHYPIRKGIVPRTIGYVRAVDDISFSIKPGQTLGLVGESGCGKTTAGRTIVRLIEPTSGRVCFDGRDVFGLTPSELRSLRREMQIIFQDPFGSLNPRMSVGAMLAEPILVHKGSRGQEPGQPKAPLDRLLGRSARRLARDHVAELLRLVGLEPDCASRYPHEFSGGQRQRLGIARALAVRPRLIVCDEAVSALDMSVQAQVLNLLSDLQNRLSLTYLFIAHDLAVVRHVSNRVAVMYLGQIVEEASTDDIFANPLHPYTQALLVSIPVPRPRQPRAPAGLEGDAPSSTDPPKGCRFHTRCPIAVDECREVAPPLTEITPGHRVACIRTDVSVQRWGAR